MALELEGKVALITGASRGIGRAIADRLAREGCDCVVAARTEETLRRAARQIAADSGRRVESCAGDLRAPEGCRAVHAQIEEQFGRLDILINNAGATKGGPFLEQDDVLWEDGFALKFYACVRLSRLCWPLLRQSQGSVVNVVGGFARTPDPDFMIGGAVNAAMANFTKALAGLGLRDDVNVNAVYPGLTETRRVEEIFTMRAKLKGVSPEQVRADMVKGQGIRRLGSPEDVADLTAFLCSPRSRHVQGTAIAVDGGATTGLY